jgi:hypothetical protein
MDRFLRFSSQLPVDFSAATRLRAGCPQIWQLRRINEINLA